MRVTCPEGTVLTGGGGWSSPSNMFLKESYPDPANPTTWIVTIQRAPNTQPLNVTWTAYAICATAAQP